MKARRAGTRGTALALALALVAGCQQPAAPPRIAFEHSAYDFGAVEQGAIVRHEFPLQNAGGSSLRIEEVRTGCGCVAAVAPAAELEPGAAGVIEASLDTAGTFGTVERTITVYSSDPVTPIATLTLRGEVTAEVAAVPAELYVGRVRRGDVLTAQLRLAVQNGVRVREVRARTGRLAARLEDAGEGSPGVTLLVAPDAPLGPFRETVEIETTSTRRPRFSVPVAGTVEGELRISPGSLLFGTVGRGEEAERVAALHNGGARPVLLLEAKVRGGSATVRVETVRPGYEYRIRVRLRTDLREGMLRDWLDLTTDHPEETTLAAPIHAAVR